MLVGPSTVCGHIAELCLSRLQPHNSVRDAIECRGVLVWWRGTEEWQSTSRYGTDVVEKWKAWAGGLGLFLWEPENL